MNPTELIDLLNRIAAVQYFEAVAFERVVQALPRPLKRR